MKHFKRTIFLLAVMISLVSVNMVWPQVDVKPPKPIVEEITVEGMINGINCYAQGEVCPLSAYFYHHLDIDDTYVFMTDTDVYHITNLDKNIMTLFLLKPVRVTGKVEKVSGSILLAKLEENKGGSWETVWSQAGARKEATHHTW